MDSKHLASINNIEENLKFVNEIVEGISADFIYNIKDVSIIEWTASQQKI